MDRNRPDARDQGHQTRNQAAGDRAGARRLFRLGLTGHQGRLGGVVVGDLDALVAVLTIATSSWEKPDAVQLIAACWASAREGNTPITVDRKTTDMTFTSFGEGLIYGRPGTPARGALLQKTQSPCQRSRMSAEAVSWGRPGDVGRGAGGQAAR